MCGFAGFLDLRPRPVIPDAARILAAMAATLERRGPDAAGLWFDARAAIGLAHRRLAVLDPTPAAAQPMTSADGNLVLAYNGEIYNQGELRRELEDLGRRFRTRSDTEVLLEALATWGVAATLARLVGMYAFALWDRSRRTLTLTRDRVGIKPLCWGRFGHTLVFGSTLDAIAAHPAFSAELDRAALAAYVRYGHVPAPASIYRHVRKLLPGTWLEVHADGAVREHWYWHPAEVFARCHAEPLEIDFGAAVEELERLLEDAVGRRLRADVPVGVLLSGGIDSALVAALARRHTRDLPAFTVAYPGSDYDEMPRARAIAIALGLRHEMLAATPARAREACRWLPEAFDEPLAVRSQLPALLVARLARTRAVVALAGDGGDELFGGYPGYAAARLLHALAGVLRPAWRAWAGRGLARLLDGITPLLRPVLGGRPLPRHEARMILDAFAQGADLATLYAAMYTGMPDPILADRAPAPAPMLWENAPFRDVCGDAVDRMGYFALLGTLVDRSLARLDRAGMAFGLEVRVPLLDHRLVEFAWRLPPALKSRGRPGSKPLLRSVLRRHLPAPLTRGPKRGFSSPLPAWLRRPLAPRGRGAPGSRRAAPRRPVRRATGVPHLAGLPRRPQRHVAAAVDDPAVPSVVDAPGRSRASGQHRRGTRAGRRGSPPQ